jgi:hypothetical protein
MAPRPSRIDPRLAAALAVQFEQWWAAAARRRRAGGLKGSAWGTASASAVAPGDLGDRVTADLGPLGRVEVTISG